MQKKQSNSSDILQGHGYRLHYNPVFGGRLDGIFYHDIPILRETLDYSSDNPLQSACFPLVPFSNRIRNGAFNFNGKHYRLEPNWDGDQPVIHGEAWQNQWQVIQKSEHQLVMKFEGQGWWPWHYRATQSFILSAQGIDIKLEIENLADSEMPAGLGFHPYFPKYADTLLQFHAGAIWPPMDAKPMQACNAPHLSFNHSRNINEYGMDHCFEKLRGDIIIQQPSLGLKIIMQCALKDMASAQSHNAIVYNPTEDYFCVEPVSHITAAIGSDDIGKPINILKKNEKLSLYLKISGEISSEINR